jgi:hypothetical protein
MKRLIVLSIPMAVMVLVAALAHAQSPAPDLKPTFISPTPGLFVNGWPAFTVSYPKEWGEAPLAPGNLFAAGVAHPDIAPGVYLPLLRVSVVTNVSPLEDWAKGTMPFMLRIYTDLKVLSDKPSQLKDGTPAREAEWEGVLKYDAALGSIKNGPKISNFVLITKKDLAWIQITLIDDKKIGEGLKRIAYSLTFQPGREAPVNVPPDVRAFLDMYCTDVASGDAQTIMAHFSDRFLFSGTNKAFMEQWLRSDPASPIQKDVISEEPTVTVFEPRGDKAYVDGFFLMRAKGDANALKTPMSFQQIIKENGEWKWYGNQK